MERATHREVPSHHKDQSMSINEIKEMYPNQWVAVAATEVNQASQCVSGRLLGASPEMPKLHAVIAKLDPHRQPNPVFIFTGSRTQA